MTPEQERVLHTQEFMLYDYADHYAMGDTNDEVIRRRSPGDLMKMAERLIADHK